jgi:hypothetical protein
MQYAPMNATIAIFHLGGATIVFKPGRLNHVSKPVAFSKNIIMALSINVID